MLVSEEDRGAYIDGVWHRGEGDPVEVYKPADASVLTTVSSASAGQVAMALASARRALFGWARTPAAERGRIVRGLADLVDTHSSDLLETLVLELGKRRSEAEGEVAGSAEFLRYNAEWGLRLEGDILPGDVVGESVNLERHPVGVVAAICPWNYPLAILCRKLGPALTAGNTVVVKPSEISPVATLALFQLIHDHLDIPPGVLNLVVGGPDVGRALVDHGGADLVTFTGHRDTGKAIMAAASAHLTRVSLELGGKAPAIVWRDADLELAVGSVVAARHTNCGQICTSAERVLVHREVASEFIDRYVSKVGSLTVGDPAGSADLGPMASAAQLAKTSAAIEAAVEEGARLLTGGSRPAGDQFADGYWIEPAVLGDVTPSMRIMQDETFGPVTPICVVDELDEALHIANDSQYGLSAYLYSRDYPTIMRSVDELEFGEIYVNRTLGESKHAHHSGWKQSGLGGEDGKWGMLRYTQLKTVYHHWG